MSPSCSREDRITISLPENDVDNNNNNEIYIRLESVTKTDHRTHPLLLGSQSPAATRRIFADDTAFIRSVAIYMASESTKVMPHLRLFEDDEVSVVRTGPSGIIVQVEFDSLASSTTSTTVLDLFYALLIDLVDLQVLPGPFGLSLQRHRLHRHVECTTTTGATTTTTWQKCTAHVPLDGADSAASAESFRQFLQGGRGSSSSSAATASGIFSFASPHEWSSWWMGKASQSLDDARNVMAGSGFYHHLDDYYSIFPTRPARWMEWSRNCSSDASNNSCQWMVAQGIQYNVFVRSVDQKLATSSLPLSSLLPTTQLSILSIDPFADHTLIDLVHTGRKKRIALAEMDQLLYVDEHSSARRRYTATTPQLDLSRVFLRDNDDSDAMTTPPITYTGRCSVHSRILRDRGQSNTGTLELYTENACRGGLCHVTIVQKLPTFFAPIWRSLKVLVDDQSIPFRELRAGSHIDFHDDGSSQITMHSNATSLRLLLDYDPVFLSIDSFPGNANRGFEFPPAMASFQCGTTSTTRATTVHLYTDTQLVLSPLPDMSMPFNVISLTCTFYAFVVGSILNLAIKKASKHVKDQLNPDNTEPDSLAGKIKAKVSSLFRGVYQKLRHAFVRSTSTVEPANQSAAMPLPENVAVLGGKKDE
jgi:Gpi16 subunit, GPI transamidase component